MLLGRGYRRDRARSLSLALLRFNVFTQDGIDFRPIVAAAVIEPFDNVPIDGIEIRSFPSGHTMRAFFQSASVVIGASGSLAAARSMSSSVIASESVPIG